MFPAHRVESPHEKLTVSALPVKDVSHNSLYRQQHWRLELTTQKMGHVAIKRTAFWNEGEVNFK
jgi:hypothetical protein